MPGFELFSEEERQEVNQVLETGILMRYNFEAARQGQWKAREFEKELAQWLDIRHCQLVSSGTAALTVALATAGVGAGDEVIMPSFTFVASFEAILSVGAVPIVVDIDHTLTLCPKQVEKAITPKTKCIMPVHMCGGPAQLQELHDLCKKHHLILLEDACQALGGKYDGKYLGTYGDLGCFSFDFVKTITCGEGGAVVTNNPLTARLSDHFQDHGHDHIGTNRGAENHPFLGYNFRISELHAAVGLAQLRKLDTIIDIQQKNYQLLRNTLAQITEVQFRTLPETGVENYSFLNFFLPTAEQAETASKRLAEAGIDGCFYWFKNNWHYITGWQHLQDVKTLFPFSKEVQKRMKYLKEADFSQSHHYMSRNLSVLIKLSWTEEEVQQRATAIKNTIASVLSP